jgi:hypothetical protein
VNPFGETTWVEEQWREQVLPGRAARGAWLERELALLPSARPRPPAARRRVTRWLGRRLTGIGERLVAIGRQMAAPAGTTA